MLKIITQQLAEKLAPDHFLLKNQTIDPKDFNKLNNLLNSVTNRKLCVFDATISTKIQKHEIIQLKDHINNTGTNILIGQQKTLGIDFTDMSNLYSHDKNSITTNCCGEILDTKKEFPSHYICHITTLARAKKFKKIFGFLYNTIEQSPSNL